mmetsp:Transcript_3699/g.11919  ORF Transcript_3699/g.11919 Transcript_3699/m.11919 type:complete len:259 (+) Transcript_3699:176-952(+)
MLDALGKVPVDLVQLDQRVDVRPAVRAVRAARGAILGDPRGALLADAAVRAGQQDHAAGHVQADDALRHALHLVARISLGIRGLLLRLLLLVRFHLPAKHHGSVRLIRLCGSVRGLRARHRLRRDHALLQCLDLQLLPEVFAALLELETPERPRLLHELLLGGERGVDGEPVCGSAAEADEDTTVGGSVLHRSAGAALHGPHALRGSPDAGQALALAQHAVDPDKASQEHRAEDDGEDPLHHARRHLLGQRARLHRDS